MSVIAFRPFMTVTVEEQGTRKSISALVFDPTSRTSTQLANHKLIFRRRANGFQLYAQHNVAAGNVRLAPITGPTSFYFSIKLTEPDFLDRYHPDLNADTGPCLYLSNLEADGSMRPSGSLSGANTVEQGDATRIAGRRLNTRADLTVAPRPTSLKVTDRHDSTRTVATVPINAPASAETAIVAIDLTDDSGYSYALEPQPTGSPKATLLADDEIAGRGAFGALELLARPLPGPDPSAGRTYTATFRRRT